MRFHEVTQTPNDVNGLSEGRTAFMPTTALARAVGKEWAGARRMGTVGVEIQMHNIPAGRDNMFVFINKLVGFDYKPAKKKGKK